MPSAEAAYIFRHTLLREAAYQLQLPEARARLHGLALSIVEGICGGREDLIKPLAFELAEHARLAQGASRADRRGLGIAEARYLGLAALHAEEQGQPEFAARLCLRLAEHGSLDASQRATQGVKAGNLFNSAGMSQAGIPALERALGQFRALGDGLGESRAHLGLGSIYHMIGRMAESEAHAMDALALARKFGDAGDEAAAQSTLALVLMHTGRIGEAEQQLNLALNAARAGGDKRAQRTVLQNLGTVYFETGRLALAMETARESLSLRDDESAGATLDLIASIFQLTGEVENAETWYRRAIAEHRQRGNLRNEGVALGNLADLFKVTGRLEQARETVLQALAINRETGNRRSEGHMLMQLGNIAGHMKLAAEVDANYAAALAIFRETGDLRQEGILLGNLADTAMKRREFARAEPMFHQALEIHRRMNNRRSESITIGNLGLLYLATGRADQAREHFGRGLAMLSEVGDRILADAFLKEWAELGGGALPEPC